MGRSTRIIKLFFHIFHILLLYYLTTNRPFRTVTRTIYTRFLTDIKHILLWSPIDGISDNGQEQFVKKRCPHLNCYLTSNRTLFNDTRIFDAIIFTAPYVSKKVFKLPKHRSTGQKFIFASGESPDKHPICDAIFDDFFNWTWTYRADSTIQYRFISTFNLDDDELGTHFKWNPYMLPLKKGQKAEQHSKIQAVAWFADNCNSTSKRESFVKELQTELTRFNLTVDIYGKCGPLKCKRKSMNACHWKLKRFYYFYLALEDYLGVDYVTTEVLHAFKGNAVPIVYGGAQYTKFLPPDSYVDSIKMTVSGLAEYIHKVMTEAGQNRYHDHFRWKNHYKVVDSEVLDACALCEALNRPNFLEYRLIHQSFRAWWEPKFAEHCTRSYERIVRIL